MPDQDEIRGAKATLFFDEQEEKEDNSSEDTTPSANSALERYEEIRTSRKLFHPGSDFITVHIYDDNEEGGLFGDPDNPAWIQLDTLSPETDPPPGERLYQLIQEEYPPGGWAMIQFWRSNKKKPSQKQHNPIFLPITPSFGNSALDRQKFILEMKRQDRKEKEEMEMQKEARKAEASALEKLLEMNMERERMQAEKQAQNELQQLEQRRLEKEKELGLFQLQMTSQENTRKWEEQRRAEEKESQHMMFQNLLQQVQQGNSQMTNALSNLIGGGGRSLGGYDDENKNVMAAMMQQMSQQSSQNMQLFIAMMQQQSQQQQAQQQAQQAQQQQYMTLLVEAMKGNQGGDEKYVALLQQSYNQALTLQQASSQQMMTLIQNQQNPTLDTSLSSLAKNISALQNISGIISPGESESSGGFWDMAGKVVEKVGPEAIDRLLTSGSKAKTETTQGLRESTMNAPADYLSDYPAQDYLPQKPPPPQNFPQPPSQTVVDNSLMDQASSFPAQEQTDAQLSSDDGIFGLEQEHSRNLEKDLIQCIRSNYDPKEFVSELPITVTGYIKADYKKENFVSEIQSKTTEPFLKSVVSQKWLAQVRDEIYK